MDRRGLIWNETLLPLRLWSGRLKFGVKQVDKGWANFYLEEITKLTFQALALPLIPCELKRTYFRRSFLYIASQKRSFSRESSDHRKYFCVGRLFVRANQSSINSGFKWMQLKKFYKTPIHLIPKWRPINYFFVCMLISPLCLIFTSKILLFFIQVDEAKRTN